MFKGKLGKEYLAYDIRCVLYDCMYCTEKQCKDECRQFALEQVKEIADKATPEEHELIYL